MGWELEVALAPSMGALCSVSQAWLGLRPVGGEHSAVWVPIVLTVAAVVCAWWNAVLLVTNA